MTNTIDATDVDDKQPSTPRRGRERYGTNLGKDGAARVPLHRRGTSRTYERLEDLLREAGYKETRVFTPEAERLEVEAEARREREQEQRRREEERKVSGSSSGGSVGAVVNFLSGFIPGTTQNANGGKTLSLGRAAGKQAAKIVSLDEDDWVPSSPSPNAAECKNAASHSSSASASTMSLRPPTPEAQPTSAARTSLRHMVSAPSIPRRPNGQPPIPQRRATDNRLAAAQPPLPANWLQNVAKALLLGGVAPQPNHHDRSLPPRPQRPLYKHSHTHALLDTTNGQHVLVRAPRATPGVTKTSVVCRSAPGSRSSSCVRGRSAAKDNKTKGKDRLPSLGARAVEGGRWAPHSCTSYDGSIHMNLDNYDGGVQKAASDASDSESDTEELDLARLLVPAKRQKSIRSLRKHLHDADSHARKKHFSGARLPRTGSVSAFARVNSPASGSTSESRSSDMDDLFESGMGGTDIRRRGRQGSIDGCGEGEWGGMPGLCVSGARMGTSTSTKSKTRAPLPWTTWPNGRP